VFEQKYNSLHIKIIKKVGIFLMVLSLVGCFGLSRPDPKKVVKTQGSVPGATFSEKVILKKIETSEPEIAPTISGPDLLILNLRCEPKDGSEVVEPLVRIEKLGDYLAYVDGLDSITKEEVMNASAIIFKRDLTVEKEGALQEVQISYLVPMKVFLKLAPDGNIAPIKHLLYQVGMFIPSELLLYFLEQSSIPQFDDPLTYSQNRTTLLHYFQFYPELRKKILDELQADDDFRSSLQIYNVSQDDSEHLVAYRQHVSGLEDNNEVDLIFVSPDICRYHAPLKINLPKWSHLREFEVTGIPSEIIYRIHSNTTNQWLIIVRWFICPSPTPATPAPLIRLGGPGTPGSGIVNPCDPSGGE
jgi:hypothetical protein